ncbi:tubulin-specific chaperone cofactor E-like protein isoform X2 [Antedon mediterranea]|uniref:tubulin-specific chaperone cofactor E-like protein isoform X2 n=1 Tax=Antedon mediterranea TaxID=105859 RepID=UPI003AF4B3EF
MEKSMSLLAAINDKYSISEEDLTTNIKFGDTDISKAKAYFSQIPESVTLQHYGIDSIGQSEELRKLCQNVRTLDVAGNKLTNWNEVLLISQCLPRLEFLNISQNLLSGEFPDPGDVIASNVNTLILNNIDATWKDISQLQKCLPFLEELHFSLTDKSNISPDASQWPSLKCLHCSSSGLSTWQDLHALSQMIPNLQSLTIVENPIFSFGDKPEMLLQELKCLNMSKTCLNNWNELEKLRKLPKLCDLRIKGIPLMDGLTESHRRQHTVARLPMIKTLNGSSVSETEREAAERAFLRFYLPREDKPARFSELHEVHKDIKPLVDVDLSPKNIVTCIITFEGRKEMRKINVKMTVGELKKSLKEFVGLPLNEFRILHKDPVIAHGAIPVMNPKKFLYSFVHDGDEFICEQWKSKQYWREKAKKEKKK